MTWTARITRRPLLASLAGLFGVAVVGGGVYEGVRLFGRRYPRTRFDDLLDQLPDRESAAKIGRTAAAQAGARLPPTLQETAEELRKGPGGGSLARAVEADIDHGRLVPIEGWLLPLSLVEVAVIAAGVQQPS